jgi:hypothetical protein
MRHIPDALAEDHYSGKLCEKTPRSTKEPK